MRIRTIVVCCAAASVMAAGPEARVRAARGQAPSLAAVLAAVGTYLDTYQQKFAAVVAHEDYELGYTVPALPNSSVTMPRTARRTLSSDVMMLNLGPAEWVQFRDVTDVDGKPVRDDANRLATILTSPASGVLVAARAIANESARYNIGVARNFNVPTMALAYVGRKSQDRSVFSLKGRETIDGVNTIVLAFEERAQPGLIRATNGKVETHGRVWVEPDTGAVRRTELDCRVDRSNTWVAGTVTVNYAPEPALKLLVPVRMDEDYHRDSGENDGGHATYTKFRAFNVDTSAIRRGGGIAAVSVSPRTIGERP